MEKQAEYYEAFALYFERVGLTRMAGRIIALLLISDPPRQSMPDICAELKASKSAVSVALKQLVTLKLVEQISLPGERRDYYRASTDMWTRSLRGRMHQLTELVDLAEHGLSLLADAAPDQRRRLEMMRDMNAFMLREFPKLLDAWDEEKRRLGYDDL